MRDKQRDENVAIVALGIMIIIGLPVMLFMIRDGLPVGMWTVLFYLFGTYAVSALIADAILKKK